MSGLKEEKWQKALGTLKKYQTFMDISFTVTFETSVIVNAANEKNAVKHVNAFITTVEGRAKLLQHLAEQIAEQIMGNPEQCIDVIRTCCNNRHIDDFTLDNVEIIDSLDKCDYNDYNNEVQIP